MNSEINHKKQLAIAVHKGKILELKYILENASGGGDWRRVIITRIDVLEKELLEIQDFVPKVNDER